MAKLKDVPQKHPVKAVTTLKGQAVGPAKCKRISRSVMKQSRYHKLTILSADGSEGSVGGTLFVAKSLGFFPKKVTLTVELG